MDYNNLFNARLCCVLAPLGVVQSSLCSSIIAKQSTACDVVATQLINLRLNIFIMKRWSHFEGYTVICCLKHEFFVLCWNFYLFNWKGPYYFFWSQILLFFPFIFIFAWFKTTLTLVSVGCGISLIAHSFICLQYYLKSRLLATLL